jgi:hypothetical protein
MSRNSSIGKGSKIDQERAKHFAESLDKFLNKVKSTHEENLLDVNDTILAELRTLERGQDDMINGLYKYQSEMRTINKRTDKMPDTVLESIRNDKMSAKVDYELFQNKAATDEVKIE